MIRPLTRFLVCLFGSACVNGKGLGLGGGGGGSEGKRVSSSYVVLSLGKDVPKIDDTNGCHLHILRMNCIVHELHYN